MLKNTTDNSNEEINQYIDEIDSMPNNTKIDENDEIFDVLKNYLEIFNEKPDFSYTQSGAVSKPLIKRNAEKIIKLIRQTNKDFNEIDDIEKLNYEFKEDIKIIKGF
eukprot:gene12035-5432_t